MNRIGEKPIMDFAPAQTWMLVCEFLTKNKIVIMTQPPYSSDLSLADFFLFPKLKTSTKRKHFAMIEKIKGKSKEELLAILKNLFQNSIGKNAGINVLHLKGVTLKDTRNK